MTKALDIDGQVSIFDFLNSDNKRGPAHGKRLIGLVDADNWGKLDNCFPNIALMKLSAWHKAHGDAVEWYDPQKAESHEYIYIYTKVYVSKIFSFTPDPSFEIIAEDVEYGGSGYCISLGEDGKEHFDKSKDKELPYEIEHAMPDYSLYGITDTAYGFMSRGCPRGCGFCHVKDKEGLCAHKVADLSEFWSGQKYIQLMDPNTLACKDWKDILQQLIDSKAWVDFNQGVDIRMMTAEKAAMLKQIKIKSVHFAYDRYQDKKYIEPKFRTFKESTGWGRSKVQVYVLTNFDTTIEQDLDRIMFLRSLDFCPYVMLYNKQSIQRGDIHFKLARWCNNRRFFWKYPTLEEYMKHEKETH